MRKKEAAEFLGISVKSLERYTQKKRVGVSYVRGKTGNEADYDNAELERFKQELSQTSYIPAVVKDGQHGQAETSLAIIPKLVNEDGSSKIISLLESMVKYQKESIAGEKLTLSLAEAATLAGLSKNYLKKAIDGGELKAAKRGKGWNIKRTDLEEWVEGL
jgi:excisionase family DNA binding protein